MNAGTGLIRKVGATIAKYGMIRPKDRIVVAVSGGPDSVCLLRVLLELKDMLGIELVAAHLDHGLRPREDEGETRFVKSLCASFDLPCHLEKAEILGSAKASIEEDAREARYRFLERVRERFGARKIAMGHTLNDQAETVIMRLLRGSGAAGLSGIPPCRDTTIIRPLIEVSRAEVLSWLEERNRDYVVDSSNSDMRYLRNRIRTELLPLLRDYQPRIVERLGQLAEMMRADETWLSAQAEAWLQEHAEAAPRGQMQISLSRFRVLPQALRNRVLRHALKTTAGSLRRVSWRHVESISGLAWGEKPQARIMLPNNLVVKRVYNQLVFSVRKESAREDFAFLLEAPGTFRLEKIGCSLSLKGVEDHAQWQVGLSPRAAFLDSDKVKFPLVLRNFRPGDRFVPCGMRGRKKIKDFFIDLKLQTEVRKRIPILTDTRGPVWVCGYRVDDRVKLTPETKTALKVELLWDSGPDSPKSFPKG